MEERTAESQMIFGLNSFRELCCLNLGGSSMTSSMLLLQCAKRAAKHAKDIVDRVKELLVSDAAAREAGQSVSFTECMRLQKISAMAEDRLALKLRNFSFQSTHEQQQQQNQDQIMKEEVQNDEETEEGFLINFYSKFILTKTMQCS